MKSRCVRIRLSDCGWDTKLARLLGHVNARLPTICFVCFWFRYLIVLSIASLLLREQGAMYQEFVNWQKMFCHVFPLVFLFQQMCGGLVRDFQNMRCSQIIEMRDSPRTRTGRGSVRWLLGGKAELPRQRRLPRHLPSSPLNFRVYSCIYVSGLHEESPWEKSLANIRSIWTHMSVHIWFDFVSKNYSIFVY